MLYRFAAICLALLVLASELEAGPITTPSRQNTTRGMLSPNPRWSAGVQLGSHDVTGLAIQRVGVNEGAVNGTLSVGGGHIGLYLDYLLLWGLGRGRLHLRENDGYLPMRGAFTPSLGLGLGLTEGVYFRVPAGIQYTFARDPIDLFGGLAFAVGPFISKDKFSSALWVNVGVRALL